MENLPSSSTSYDIYSQEWCRHHRFPNANPIYMLRDRELGMRRLGTQFMKGSREFYYSMRPTCSKTPIERPAIFPIRFTPDGQKLIALSPSLQAIEVYQYNGVHVLANKKSNVYFDALFKKLKTISVLENERLTNHVLARDCFLVTPDSKHLIVCTSATIAENYSRFSAIQRNSESLMINTAYLDDYYFYSIDLEKGEICDQVHFDFDRIYISQGIYLTDRIMAILSVQHQTIHMFEIAKSTGHLIPLMNIGRGMKDDDNMFDFFGSSSQSQATESWMTAFKQRFLSFLYYDHKHRGALDDFIKNITSYRSLKMHRLQMLGPELILVKMSHKDYLSSHADQGNVLYMFVIFEWRTGKFVGVFNRQDPKLLELYEKHNESFRYGYISQNHYPMSMTHCFWPKLMHDRVKSNWVVNDGQTLPPDACRRFLSILPFSITNVPTATPYLDPNMFSYYDERVLNQIERGRVPVDTINPFRTFSRRTQRLALEFELDPSLIVGASQTAKILFHPTDPFAFAFDKSRVDTHLQFFVPEFHTEEL